MTPTPMHEIVPPATPKLGREKVLELVTEAGHELPAFPFLVGQRGYYSRTMGPTAGNDIAIYDDALFLVERMGMIAYNFNADPGAHAPGMANLKPGLWLYRPGIHNISKDPKTHPHYEALVQAAPVVVVRDGQGEDRGLFGINIHCGGWNVVSSLGCQTVPPAQWGDKFTPAPRDFMPTIHRALAREGRDTTDNDKNHLAYVLTTTADY